MHRGAVTCATDHRRMRNWIDAPLLKALTSPASLGSGMGRRFPFQPAETPPESAEGSREESGGTLRVRTVWISDVHLGTPGCQAHALLDFL